MLWCHDVMDQLKETELSLCYHTVGVSSSCCHGSGEADWIILVLSYCHAAILMLSRSSWPRLYHSHAVILSCCHGPGEKGWIILMLSYCHLIILMLSRTGWTDWIILMLSYFHAVMDHVKQNNFFYAVMDHEKKTESTTCCHPHSLMVKVIPTESSSFCHTVMVLSLRCHGPGETYWIILMLSYCHAVILMLSLIKWDIVNHPHVVMLSCCHGPGETDWFIFMLSYCHLVIL